MKRKSLALYLFFFFILAGLVSAFILLLGQVRAFTISDHTFHPSLDSFILLTVISFFALVIFWILYAGLAARFLSLPSSRLLAEDFSTYLPLIFFSLVPLALRHYISADDLKTRLVLLALGIGFLLLFLKTTQWLGWSRENPAACPNFIRRLSSLSPRKKMALLFLAALLIFNAGTLFFHSRGATFGGDEPHYLLMTHSLLEDGDLDLANNYDQRDYLRFMKFEGKMKPHAVWGARPGSLYSSHSPGIAVLLLPFYGLGSLFKGKALIFFIRLGMSVFGALFALQVFLYARSEWREERLAIRLWLFVSFTSPVFFYSIHVYPELVVALLSLTVFRIFRFSSLTPQKIALGALFLSSFIWFHSLKYLPLFVPLFFYGLWTVAKKSRPVLNLALFILIPVLVFSLYLVFQHALYGSYSLSAVSWARAMSGEESVQFARGLLFGIPMHVRWETLAGYFFDQRDGLLFYSPLFFFALLGAWEMWRRRRGDLFLLLLIAAPYVLVSAFLTQRGGYAPQARPMVAVIWGLAIMLGYFLAHAGKTVFKLIFNLAAFLSFLVVFLLLTFPTNLYQETTRGAAERGGGLFYLLSNIRFHLPDCLPSYLKVESLKWLPNLTWLGVAAIFIIAYIAIKKRVLTLSFSGRGLLACAGLIIFFVWIVLFPRKVLLNPLRTAFPGGERITFYSVSRSARMIEPGKFQLREDNRAYHFSLVTRRSIQELKISFGSVWGDYDVEIQVFDQSFFRGKTAQEMREVNLWDPPRYKLGQAYYYELILILGKGTAVQTELNPYLFAVAFTPGQD